MRRAGRLLTVLLMLLPGGHAAGGGDVASSSHNLSVSGPGSIGAETETRVCVFCHTPHNARPAAPLWNHESSVAAYSTYGSSTLSITGPLPQPNGASKLCLSCHDGTVALGQTVNDGLIALLGTGSGGRMPPEGSDLGIDLTDDHPVSFATNPAQPETRDPPPGDAVSLDEAGEIQCTACHDPHREDVDPVSRRFLVKGNQASELCLTCHLTDYWSTNPSAHQSSTAAYPESAGAHTGYGTVRDNGCESCHRPHSGLEPQRLLKFVEELTCDACHDGSVASRDVSAEFNKPYAHPTFASTPSVHDAAEGPNHPSAPLPEISPGAPRHAECQDCHNPHAAYAAAAAPPAVPGALSGMWGIDGAGVQVDPAPYGYQVCYKCHADSENRPQPAGPFPPYTRRQVEQFNVRLEFDPANPSHHAVEAPGRNPDVPSLLPPYTAASVIGCDDCHNSDDGPGAGGAGPAGPHGSTFNHLLERNLEVGDGNGGENFAAMYAMCFKCHSEQSVMSETGSFRYHRMHIDGENTSCTVCHDPHGISATQGSATANSHLINFDLDVVLPNSNNELRFEDRGSRSGACYLRCHGDNHNPETY